MLSREDIDSYFRRRDWRFLKQGDNVWRTGVRDRLPNYQKNFQIFVHLDADWVYFQVPLVSDIKQDCSAALYEFLLQLNYQAFLAKFCLQGNAVILTSELPRSCDQDQFNDALWSVDEYANRYFLEILTMSQDTEIANLWSNRDRQTEDEDSAANESEVPEIILNM
jgi:hypothetical protein